MTTNRDRLNPGMKMAELMDRDNALCGVLERVGLSFGFGDETVGEVCAQSGIDSATFLLICNVYLSEDYTPSREILEKIDLRDIIRYLRLSHTYYEDTSAKSLSLALALPALSYAIGKSLTLTEPSLDSVTLVVSHTKSVPHGALPILLYAPPLTER